MNAATASEIARLETMTITKVVERFESLVGEKCRSRNKRYLIRRIAWRLQANAEGDKNLGTVPAFSAERRKPNSVKSGH
jgi:hypothetical protein